mmetsp:Transcript_16932/g.25540  ORF Transcript_16932/g.25540 Transcript_16932/m.25540 type:complete len:1258 (+) Transcript_16932:167-3940(+)|eukprot:CAMPEP_0185036028 /NCGR_PEP_ID=MMETSP1103-20130426/28381_1 /TAXON_ID=36769 /ORGANISM="Paraphysomonas bandaiensis, Strain Caron Lab Isolate" /LENGTH=1257 /DNA_ID=CAMNT_0027573391 /DNA_START=96 /DNA_END=3869 /DNA_ORIENTATION=+
MDSDEEDSFVRDFHDEEKGEDYPSDDDNGPEVNSDDSRDGGGRSGGLDIAEVDKKVADAIQKRRAAKAAANLKSDSGFIEDYKDVDERLGDDFEDTRWVPPTLELAWEWRLDNLYRGGRAKQSRTKLTKSTDLGQGVPLYFLFIQTIAYALVLMSLLSVPALLFAYYGSHVAESDKDFAGLYKLTVGNIGYDPESARYAERSACSGNPDIICVRLFSLEFSLQSVAGILTVCELLQALVFMAAVWRLKARCNVVRKRTEGRLCSASDYAVRVDNIPPDTTLEQLVDHFSNLYCLDKPDWRGRYPLEDAKPLQHCNNTGKAYHIGTWVAEATVYSEIGSLIRAFKDKKMLMTNLLRHRARMKMYKGDTPHSHGPNPAKYRIAERDMLHAGSQIDDLTRKSLLKAKKNVITTDAPNSTSQVKGLNAQAHTAYVIFNYSESMARCLDDYSTFNLFPFKIFMPGKMMFRGHRITVTQACEPDEIVWENLEVSSVRKMARRAISAVFALCLLIVGFAIILQAAEYRRVFNEEIPKLNMCHKEIPALYAGSYDFPSGVEIVRPDPSEDDTGRTRDDYDLECTARVKGSFYAIYTTNGNFNSPLANYSITDVCKYGSSAATTDCPLPDQSVFCPCLSSSSSDTCETLSCEESNGNCDEFKASTVAGCFCYQELLSLFSSPLLSLWSQVQTVDANCEEFLTSYGSALLLTVAASLCTVVINFVLKSIMKYLAKREFHTTVDEEHRAIVVKVFIATYINMAFVALLAYGYVNKKPSIVTNASILDSEYSDFDPEWYGNVGFYLIVTFIIQMISPLASVLFKYYIAKPCRMCRAHPKIESLTSHKYPMQADVNALELGGVFDTTVHTAQLLSLLFFGMTYAGGMPLMMPLLAATFCFYFATDKMLLLRYYQIPPKMSDAVMRVVLSLLPWVCVIRLSFSCWILSNEEIFPVTELPIDALPSYSYFDSERVSSMYNTWVENQVNRDLYYINTGTRIPRGHIIPIFALMIIIAVGTILFTILRHSPLYYMARTFIWAFRSLRRLCSKKAVNIVKSYDLAVSGDPRRSEVAPYTGDYFQFLESELAKSKAKCCRFSFLDRIFMSSSEELSREDIENGWRVTYKTTHKVKVTQWEQTTRVDGVTRPKGSMKRTYEVISTYGCTSYMLHRIPHYKKVFNAIQEGVSSIADEHDEELGRASKMTVVGNYNKHKNKQQHMAEEKKKANEKLWTKQKKGKAMKSAKVAVDNDDSVRPYEDPNSESSDSDRLSDDE